MVEKQRPVFFNLIAVALAELFGQTTAVTDFDNPLAGVLAKVV